MHPPPDPADQTTPPAARRQARFLSPTGGDPDTGGAPVSLYYNPKPQAAAKKQVLQRAAARLFAQHTCTEFGLRAVAQAAHLGPTTVYYYYRDRDDLLTDLLVNHVQAINAPVCAAFDATQEAAPHERMTALLAAFLAAVHADPDAHRTLRLNTALLSDAHRPRVVGRYRQILATLREALEGCVPALAGQPEMAKLLVRLVVGAMSESVAWFRDDGPMGAQDLAILLAAQMLVSARALTEGIWPAPEPIAPSPPPAPAPAPAGLTRGSARGLTRGPAAPADSPGWTDQAGGEALWIATETALNRWGQVSEAALNGREVILTHRGWPTLQLVPATAQQQAMCAVTGRVGKRGRKAGKAGADNANAPARP
jgi:TetR/AcrR family transcriptional regulator